MKRRPGTKQAELLSKKWPIIRKATAKAQAAGLVLCRYVEFSLLEAGGESFLVATKSEEIDCLLYEVDPKSVDAERYHEADKLIGFPWCDISDDPQINAIFEEIQSGDRWIITGVLSDDPIKAFAQCACTRWYDTTQIAVQAGISVDTGTTAEINSFEDDQLFWSKTTTGATAQALTDSFVEVQQSILGPKLSDLAARADQRARFVYSASIQTLATGASGGQVSFQLQRSMELDGQPEVWSDLTGAVADISLAVAQDNRLTFAFTDTIPAGVAAGVALKYRLLAKRSDSTHGATLHAGDISPTITIDGQFLYPLPEEVPGAVSATTGTTETVSAATIVVEDATVSASSGTSATVSAIFAELEEADLDATTGTSGTVSATAELLEEAAVSAQSGVSGTVSADTGVEATVAAGTGATGTVSAATVIIEDATVSVESGTVESVSAETGLDAEVAATTGTTDTVSATAELLEDAALSASTGASATLAAWVAENIYSAPPSDPDADELGLIYEEVLGTTVTIPAQAAGYPNVRFAYNASISLLATGINGGLCTFQLQENVNGAGWADITGETATKEFAAQDQEERFTFALYAPYPTGINADESVQLRVVAKTDETGKEVEVHSSLIAPENTSPVVYAEAEYFFS
jgi:hypothetical protein